jgi:hypothetical protein
MITIRTNGDGTRTYTVQHALVAVARAVFPCGDDAAAMFALARRLSAEQLASLARLAELDHDEAVRRAADWLVQGSRAAT